MSEAVFSSAIDRGVGQRVVLPLKGQSSTALIQALTDYCRQQQKTLLVLPVKGGVLSHLKAWENIILPLHYHTRLTLEALNLRLSQLCPVWGWEAESLATWLGCLPVNLSHSQHHLCVLIRSLLCPAEVLVVEAGFWQGFPAETADRYQRQLLQHIQAQSSVWLEFD